MDSTIGHGRGNCRRQPRRELAGSVASSVKAQAAEGLQVAQSAASAGMGAAANAACAVGSAVNTGTKRTIAAAAPLTQHVTGVASAIIPGSGELMTGNAKQGACTFAAFLGATSAALACIPLLPAAPVLGVVVAVPLGIQVFSAWQGAKHGKLAGDNIRSVMSDSLTADEAARLAENMRAAAASMSPEEFERAILETEAREMQVDEAGQQKVLLKRIT